MNEQIKKSKKKWINKYEWIKWMNKLMMGEKNERMDK